MAHRDSSPSEPGLHIWTLLRHGRGREPIEFQAFPRDRRWIALFQARRSMSGYQCYVFLRLCVDAGETPRERGDLARNIVDSVICGFCNDRFLRNLSRLGRARNSLRVHVLNKSL